MSKTSDPPLLKDDQKQQIFDSFEHTHGADLMGIGYYALQELASRDESADKVPTAIYAAAIVYVECYRSERIKQRRREKRRAK